MPEVAFLPDFTPHGGPHALRLFSIPSFLVHPGRKPEIAALRAEKDGEIASLQARLMRLEGLPERLAMLEARIPAGVQVVRASTGRARRVALQP